MLVDKFWPPPNVIASGYTDLRALVLSANPLVIRGTCPVLIKDNQAFAAGYHTRAILIINAANTPSRLTLDPGLAPTARGNTSTVIVLVWKSSIRLVVALTPQHFGFISHYFTETTQLY